MPTKVLLVEDDPALSDAVREGLTDEHIDMVVVSNVRMVWSRFVLKGPMQSCSI